MYSILLSSAGRRISFLLFVIPLFVFLFAGVLAKPLEGVFKGLSELAPSGEQQVLSDGYPSLRPLNGYDSDDDDQKPLPTDPTPAKGTLKKMLDAIHVMQSEYFILWEARWPSANDWTAAVMGTQVSATLSAVSSTLEDILMSNEPTAAGGCNSANSEPFDALAYENLIDYYFHQTAAFWYGEDFFGLRLQAYDDMLWVVLEWLESIKFQNLHSDLHYSSYSTTNETLRKSWHGTQFSLPAAHRSRVFYDLASRGWDTTLCGGGMIWSPWLVPYKNAITNELFISASIGMYLYFPGDTIGSPLYPIAVNKTSSSSRDFVSVPRNPAHLVAAITAYDWLKNSKMTGNNGLYGDGFHIRGWSETDPGTGKCDVFNPMVYTYNQGVVLSGLKGLWIATASRDYLEDGHELISNVIRATGWPDKSSQKWAGLGRGGVLEEVCDSAGTCSQNGHTFKGIFFHHFAEFCRQLRPEEEQLLSKTAEETPDPDTFGQWEHIFKWHQKKCASYRSWLAHNADAAYMTKNEQGKFGMWWGRKYPDTNPNPTETATLPYGAIDYSNIDPTANGPEDQSALLRPRKNSNLNNGHSDNVIPKKHRIRKTKQPEVKNEEVPEQIESRDVNDRGRGRTVETQAGAMAVLRALYQWETTPSLADSADDSGDWDNSDD